VLLSTHILESRRRCAVRVAIIDRGQIVATGTMEECARRRAPTGKPRDLFLKLTAGPESKELIERLLARSSERVGDLTISGRRCSAAPPAC